MATTTATYTLRATVVQITLDPITSAVTVTGRIEIDGTSIYVKQHQENVTALMSQQQIDAALLLVAGAQVWIDSKLP